MRNSPYTLTAYMNWLVFTRNYSASTARMYVYATRALLDHSGIPEDTDQLMSAVATLSPAYLGNAWSSWDLFRQFAKENDTDLPALPDRSPEQTVSRGGMPMNYAVGISMLQAVAGTKRSSLSNHNISLASWGDMTIEDGFPTLKVMNNRGVETHVVWKHPTARDLVLHLIDMATDKLHADPAGVAMFPDSPGATDGLDQRAVREAITKATRLHARDVLRWARTDHNEHAQILQDHNLMPNYDEDDFGPGPGTPGYVSRSTVADRITVKATTNAMGGPLGTPSAERPKPQTKLSLEEFIARAPKIGQGPV